MMKCIMEEVYIIAVHNDAWVNIVYICIAVEQLDEAGMRQQCFDVNADTQVNR